MELLVSKKKAYALTQLQHMLNENQIPTVILFEGPGGMVMSHIINQIIGAVVVLISLLMFLGTATNLFRIF